MASMSPTETDEVWTAIDDQRARTADLLERLGQHQWEHPSLCQGWTVRHVAAHLTLQQQRVRDLATIVARNPSLLRSLTLNAMIRDSAVVQSRLVSTEEIIRRIRSMIGSRRHNAFVTPLETLTDILVHGQDIAVPLELALEMPPLASALAATRRWDTQDTWLASVFHPLSLTSYRLAATDADWTRGDGPVVEGPMGPLLLLITGRSAALDRLTGEGADALRTAPSLPA